LKPAALQVFAKRRDHSLVFPFEEPALRRGEDENPGARVAKDEEFHLPIESGTVPLVILALHVHSRVLRRWEWSNCISGLRA
jgi:hypothetical protein